MIKVDITGRLTKDLTLTNLGNGKQCCRFGLAARSNRKDDKGEYITEFVNCVAWGMTAEMLCKHSRKGDLIRAVGNWQTKTWEKNGIERKDVEVSVGEVEFLSKARENTQSTPHLDELRETGDKDDPFKDQYEQQSIDLNGDIPF